MTSTHTQNPESTVKSTMKAVVIKAHHPIEHPESFLDLELATPVATGHDLLIAVKAVSVNPVDFKVRASRPGVELPEPRTLGFDGAGVVVAVGENVTLFQPGDEVYWSGSIVRAGSNAEYQLVDERIVGKKPTTLDFAEAAALPLTAITAWESLFDRLRISQRDQGKSILIIGGAGGVGSIAIQLAKHAGLKVIATASRPETQTWVKEQGADVVISHSNPLDEKLTAVGLPEVDFIFNTVNTVQYWEVSAKVIKPQGSIVAINGTPEKLPIGILFSKSVSFHWELMFTRSTHQTPDMIEQHHLLNKVADQIDAGTLKTTLKENVGTINAENLKKAHARLESGQAIGKVVLSGW
ncbi:zinc-binding alcohol dehydrogenase family protein [Deinococcus cellulosilyticus]|uniref:Zinc-type alcohol dehydrogenase-like protein n=1 Tax=Deinococcus cellulosilyticus (strain DSM 18568 / NBRC 106333 / KACC 11606 / 5516J-15) TaxID=1223518 RepID=A0A511N3V1_DEIC1|nr:zinc-binding alcohol dehydrogenase family protein [Deinococcus cellulosilyticus]GEM47148.1 NADPH:quinone reductase [Deinococcus cellulosilyticus NBRC 106333 = KACC 11606]